MTFLNDEGVDRRQWDYEGFRIWSSPFEHCDSFWIATERPARQIAEGAEWFESWSKWLRKHRKKEHRGPELRLFPLRTRKRPYKAPSFTMRYATTMDRQPFLAELGEALS
jgi:hypothetical protein